MMRVRFGRIAAMAAVVTACFAAGTRSGSAADIARGEQLARQWCASCHVVPGDPHQTALQGPPSFRDIAHGNKTPDQIRVFLIKPHGAMPQLTLSRAEIDALVGYIESLR